MAEQSWPATAPAASAELLRLCSTLWTVDQPYLVLASIQSFLELPATTMDEFEKKLLGVAEQFKDAFRDSPRFEMEAKREIASRLLVASIDKDTGVDACVKRLNALRKFEFDDPVDKWLVVCQASRYLQQYSQQSEVIGQLVELKGEIQLVIDGYNESLQQVKDEINRHEENQMGTGNDPR